MKTFAFTLLSCFLLLGCKQYSVSLNEKVLYTPAPLFTHFSLADRQLQSCVDQTIKDLKATKAQDLTSLNCSHAGIESIEGLGIFTELQHLHRANNSISNISALTSLPKLETLILRDNKVTEGAPLLNLLHLLHLDISNNAQFDCQIAIQLRQNLSPLKPRLTFPEHC